MCSHRRVHSSAKKTPIILSGTGAKAHFFTPLFNFRWDSQVGAERRYEVGDGGGGGAGVEGGRVADFQGHRESLAWKQDCVQGGRCSRDKSHDS